MDNYGNFSMPRIYESAEEARARPREIGTGDGN